MSIDNSIDLSAANVTGLGPSVWRKELGMPHCDTILEMMIRIDKGNFMKQLTKDVSFNNMDQKTREGLKYIIAILEFRKIYSDKVLEETTHPPIFEIAAGFTPRSIEYALNPEKRNDVFYAETMLPSDRKVKQIIYNHIVGSKKPENHHFFDVNALNYEDMKPVGKAYLEYTEKTNDRRPLTILHEGLFQYFNPNGKTDERALFIKNICRFFKEFSPNGKWITPDLGMNEIYFANNEKLAKDLQLHLFKNDNETIAYFLEHNINAERIDIKPVDVSNTYSVKHLNIDEEKAKIFYQPWMLT